MSGDKLEEAQTLHAPLFLVLVLKEVANDGNTTAAFFLPIVTD